MTHRYEYHFSSKEVVLSDNLDPMFHNIAVLTVDHQRKSVIKDRLGKTGIGLSGYEKFMENKFKIDSDIELRYGKGSLQGGEYTINMLEVVKDGVVIATVRADENPHFAIMRVFKKISGE